MDAAWPRSEGEAIHTSTFLGHPVGCAMALAQMSEIRRQELVQRSSENGKVLVDLLRKIRTPGSLVHSARGLGLMAGLELRHADGSPATTVTLRAIKAMLHNGFILLPEGELANVIGFTPPLTIGKGLLEQTVRELEKVVQE
jgi:4-aminobutyrate aminotransferase-like enzyme